MTTPNATDKTNRPRQIFAAPGAAGRLPSAGPIRPGCRGGHSPRKNREYALLWIALFGAAAGAGADDDAWLDGGAIKDGHPDIFGAFTVLEWGYKMKNSTLLLTDPFMAVFKPAKILDFFWESDDREWDQSKVDAMRSNADQTELFEGDTWRQTFKLMPKLPFKFSYRFEDADGKQSEMRVLDWETGQLFWNCRHAAEGNERMALVKVREKYMGQFLKTDLHFFLGTTKEFHSWATNPFIIIGVFPIPHEKQLGLL